MRVSVRLFAALREAAGTDRFDEEFRDDPPGGATLALLRQRIADRHPALRPYLERVAIAVNEEYVIDQSTPLRDGDTVALIPPISGGAQGLPLYHVTADALDPRALRDAVMTTASGACVLFEGVVRDHHEGRPVERLEYEAYEEMAARQLRAVGEEVLARYAGREVHAIAIHHRIGPLVVGETSLLVAVAAAHRQDAFEAALHAVDRVKETVPVWKKEWGPDGAHWQEGIPPRPADGPVT